MSTQYYTHQAKRFWQTYPDSPSWMQNMRLNALSRLEKTGLPTTKNENYKYTNFDKLLGENYQVRPNTNVASHDIKSELNALQIIFLNGKLLSHNLPSEVVIKDLQSVETESMAQLLDSTGELLKDDPLFNLNETLTHIGVVINFTKDIARPIHVIYLLDEEFQDSCHAQHNFFICEKNVSVTLLEEYRSNNQCSAFNNQASTIVLKENSHFYHTIYNKQDHTNLFVNHQRVLVAKDANYQNVNLNLGSSTARYNIHIALKDTGAHASAHGLYALKGKQHCDVASFIHHIAPHTTSDQLYKGILNEEARGVFTGMVRVEKDAQLIDAKQLNRSLLLSKKAQSNARPQLEIYADDVKCSHGHTTGQIQDDELFYFESRGIRKQKAKEMLARAFSYEVLLKISNSEIRNYLQLELVKQYGNIAY
jgi:Fe-S cluster assembly protein SufD